MRLRLLRSLPLAPLVLAWSCSSPTPTGPTFVARFEIPSSGTPDLYQLPFPSDVWLNAKGTIDLPLGSSAGKTLTGALQISPVSKGAQFVVDAFAQTHGWGVYGGALFALDGSRPDRAKLPTGKPTDCIGKDAVAAIVDLDTGVAIPCQAGYHSDADQAEIISTPTLNVRPASGHVLPEGHHIAIVLTSAITDKTGLALAPSASFKALRDGARNGALQTSYGAAVDTVVAKTGIDKSRIVAAAVYTTGHVTDDLRMARELAGATPVPTIKWDTASVLPVTPAKFTNVTPLPAGWNASLDDLLGAPTKLTDGSDDPDWEDKLGIAHDGISALGTAEFDAPNFLINLPDRTYDDPTHGTFFHDSSGKLAINPSKPSSKIWVTFAIPKGTMPSGGWPVVIMQHGLGGQRSDMLAMANTIAKKGWICAGIEIVAHGTRGADAALRGDKKSDVKRSTATYNGPDGFIDKDSDGHNIGPNDFFGSLFRIAAARDQFRQTAIDHTTLTRVLASSPTLDGLALGGVTPKIDGSKIAYVGDSLGGITGAITAGIEPNISAYVLNVAGGGVISDLAANSPDISGLLIGAGGLYFGLGGAQLPPEHALVQSLQHVFDGGDPIAVAATVTKPVAIGGSTPKARNVVVIEVLADELVSNQSSESLARAMGIPVSKPHKSTLFTDLLEADGASLTNIPSAGSTGFLMQVYPAEHGNDMYGKSTTRTIVAARPIFNDPNGGDVFPRLPAALHLPSPYLQIQAMLTGFIGDAFAGKVPTVVWTTKPGDPATDG